VNFKSEARKELRTACGSSSSSSGFLGGLRGGGSLAAALGLRRSGGRFTDQLCHHDAGNEQLGTVIVEINRGALLIGCGNNAQAVGIVFDCLTLCHHLHIILLKKYTCVDATRLESLYDYSQRPQAERGSLIPVTRDSAAIPLARYCTKLANQRPQTLPQLFFKRGKQYCKNNKCQPKNTTKWAVCLCRKLAGKQRASLFKILINMGLL
jgi:hypothetical protein